MKKAAPLFIFVLFTLSAIAQNEAGLYYSAGEKKYEAGDFKGAIAEFEEVVELTHSEWAYYSRGHCQYYEHNYVAAIADMDTVLRINPNNAAALRCRGSAERVLKRYSEALDDLNKCVALGSNDTTYLNRGILRLDLNDTTGAIEDYDMMVKINPNVNSYVLRGRLKSRLKDYDGSVSDYLSARAIIPDSLDYAIETNLAWAERLLYNYPAATEEYDKLIKRYPNKAMLYVYRGDIEKETGFDYAAVNDYKKAIHIEPRNPVGYKALAYYRYSERAYPVSITAFTKAIKVDPNNPELYFFRGEVNYLLEKDKPAIKDFTKAITLSPNYALAYRRRADAEKVLGLHKQAAADYFEATELGSFKE